VTDLAQASDIHGVANIDTDAELLRRSASEPAVFGDLYKRHGVAVRRYVVSRVGIGSGEDLAAEVFIRAFRTRDKCRADHGSALPWLLGVALGSLEPLGTLGPLQALDPLQALGPLQPLRISAVPRQRSVLALAL
jgi:hypothetical protein